MKIFSSRKSLFAQAALFLALGSPVSLAQNNSQPLPVNLETDQDDAFRNFETQILTNKINLWDPEVDEFNRTLLLNTSDVLMHIIKLNDTEVEGSLPILSNDNADKIWDMVADIKYPAVRSATYLHMLSNENLARDLILHGQAEKIWNFIENAPPKTQKELLEQKYLMKNLILYGQKDKAWAFFHREQFKDPIQTIQKLGLFSDFIPGRADEILESIRQAPRQKQMDMLHEFGVITAFADQNKTEDVWDLIVHWPLDQKREFYLRDANQIGSLISHGKASEIWQDITSIQGKIDHSSLEHRYPQTQKNDPPIIIEMLGHSPLLVDFIENGHAADAYGFVMSCAPEAKLLYLSNNDTIDAFVDHGYAYEMWGLIQTLQYEKRIDILRYPGTIAKFVENGYADTIIDFINNLKNDSDKIEILSAFDAYDALAKASPLNFKMLDDQLQHFKPNYQCLGSCSTEPPAAKPDNPPGPN